MKPPRPQITSLMIMCFINEFCVKWSLNAFESRYGIYISDRWNVSSPVFSYVGNMMGEMSEIYLLLIRHEIGNCYYFYYSISSCSLQRVLMKYQQ